MNTASLKVCVFAANQAFAIADASVLIIDEFKNEMELITNEEGICEVENLKTNQLEDSLDIDYAGIPYKTLDIKINKEGFVGVSIYGVQLFAGQTTLVNYSLSPFVNIVRTNEEIIEIGPNALLMDGYREYDFFDQSFLIPWVLDYPIIPSFITVHLGIPTSSAANVTVSFRDYIKNVASSEIYPTWPKESLRANILCQISLALNRVYTEWYRSKGYDFDITNSTSYDQYFVYGRNIYENISQIVDEMFNEYLQKRNTVNPFFAQYCDGRNVWCSGLKQWGTVSLANQGYNALEIVQYYYGDDIEIVSTNRIEGVASSYPGQSLKLGSRGYDVGIIQYQLNRIAINYPLIPANYPLDGIFGLNTRKSVLAFQKQFQLVQDGIVGKASWYEISYIYVAVKKLAELSSEGVVDRYPFEYPNHSIRYGDKGVEVQEIQFLLSKISLFTPAVSSISIDGRFGNATLNAVYGFQRLAGLQKDGIVGKKTWNTLLLAYEDTLKIDVEQPFFMEAYPGYPIVYGMESKEVMTIQVALNQIMSNAIVVDGIFKDATLNKVKRFQSENGLIVDGIVGKNTWNTLALKVNNKIIQEALLFEVAEKNQSS